MFERYTITATSEELEKKFSIEILPEYKPCYNASPARLLPVITNSSPNDISLYYWGLPPSWGKNKSISQKLIHADLDQLTSKVSYKNALISRRCLVPADGIYIWKKVSKKGKIPYRYILNNHKTFLMPGLWDEFEDEQGRIVHTFLIITLKPEQSLQSFTMDMPLLLNKENGWKWLDDNLTMDQHLDVLSNVLDEKMESYPVSSRINKTSYDSPDLIQPSSPVDQYGNYSLFD
ncbi:MAG: SOS response-associated peptidase [Bacteroidetes bacterium]|nr:SOS response-associated peptidase [Bacteroidota bacterium]